MSAAVIGLIGVALGGLVSGGAQWLLARRAQRARARVAARLMRDELVWVSVNLMGVNESVSTVLTARRAQPRHRQALAAVLGRILKVNVRLEPIQLDDVRAGEREHHESLFRLWDEHRSSLATALSEQHWAYVSHAIRQVRMLLQMPEEYGPPDATYLEVVDASIHAAQLVLIPLSKDKYTLPFQSKQLTSKAQKELDGRLATARERHEREEGKPWKQPE